MLRRPSARGYLEPVTDSDRLTGRLALVLALLGLVVAVGGTSYAAVKISGSQIKKGTITAKQVKDGSLLSADFKAGQLPAGVQGPPGPAGPGAKLIALGVTPTATDTQLTSDLFINWECNPGIDAVLQATVASGQGEWTGTLWNNGNPDGQSIEQQGLVIGGLAATAQRGFTGTIRSSVSGKVVSVDALFKMDGSSCTGRVVATPLT